MCPHKDLGMNVPSRLFIIAKEWEQLKHLSTADGEAKYGPSTETLLSSKDHIHNIDKQISLTEPSSSGCLSPPCKFPQVAIPTEHLLQHNLVVDRVYFTL